MKKNLGVAIAGIAMLALVGCIGVQHGEIIENVEADVETSQVVTVANPWSDCTEEEAYVDAPNGFTAPEGATNVRWSMLKDDPSEYALGPMVQMTFDLDGSSFTAREQATTGEEVTDISGMHYDWIYSSDVTLANWAGGQMPAKTFLYLGDDEQAELCTWFDIETGYSYSIGVAAKDLDGFDIQAIAEQIYDPAKQIGANMPDDEVIDAATINATENSIGAMKMYSEESAPEIDITGCDTFTQIVDQKLSKGMGYANVTLDGEDVLLVCSMAYDNLDGNMAAIDATIFMYKDGVPCEVGKVCSGGTAYPLTVVDGKLFTGSNHWICKYALTGDKLMIMEKASVVYDEYGDGTYFYESEDGGDYSAMSSADSEEVFDQLIDEMFAGEVVNFSVVE